MNEEDFIVKEGIDLFKGLSSKQRKELRKMDLTNVPPLYKKFLMLVDIDTFSEKLYCILAEGKSERFGGTRYYPKNENNEYPIDIDCFVSLESMLDEEGDWFEDFYEEGYYFIASTSSGGAIIVGFNEEKRDKIYHYTTAQEYIELADDIFEFVSELQMVVCPIEEQDKIALLPNLYQRWGEKAWRDIENIIYENKKSE